MSDNVNRLLIVDDEPGVVDFITAAAHQLEYTVASAGTAADFLTLVDSFRPSLIVMDLHLPDGDGVELLRMLVAVRRVLAGGIYVSERVGASMIERFAVSGRVQSANPIDRLSNREVQVLNLIGRGKTTREIAGNLNLSVKTVESHRQRIKKKLNLHTAPQLVQFAVNWYSGHH